MALEAACFPGQPEPPTCGTWPQNIVLFAENLRITVVQVHACCHGAKCQPGCSGHGAASRGTGGASIGIASGNEDGGFWSQTCVHFPVASPAGCVSLGNLLNLAERQFS